MTDRMTISAVVINLDAVRLTFFCLRTMLMLMLMMTKVRDIY